jgi:hypothetical protein
VRGQTYVGARCKRGHDGLRYVSTHTCVECQKAHSKSQPQDTPFRRYHQQRMNARYRGIGWELTFDQWQDLWLEHYDRRGRESGQYVMARHGDEGPYAVGNVSIKPVEDNLAEARQNERMRRAVSLLPDLSSQARRPARRHARKRAAVAA